MGTCIDRQILVIKPKQEEETFPELIRTSNHTLAWSQVPMFYLFDQPLANIKCRQTCTRHTISGQARVTGHSRTQHV